ncbi:MAG: hypothetical protein WC966_11670 [Bradymonadales bacterium]
MRLDLRNRTQACVSAAQIVVGIVGRGKPAQSVGLRYRDSLPIADNAANPCTARDCGVGGNFPHKKE